jgi:hypothetical protein
MLGYFLVSILGRLNNWWFDRWDIFALRYLVASMMLVARKIEKCSLACSLLRRLGNDGTFRRFDARVDSFARFDDANVSDAQSLRYSVA